MYAMSVRVFDVLLTYHLGTAAGDEWLFKAQLLVVVTSLITVS